MKQAAASRRKPDEETRERVERVKAAEAERVQALAANAAAAAALGGGIAKWANWSKSKAKAAAPKVAATGQLGSVEPSEPNAAPANGGVLSVAAAPTPSGGGPADAALANGVAPRGGPATRDTSLPSGASGAPSVGSDLGPGAVRPHAWLRSERKPLSLRDLVVALERDPMYAKSTLLYKLREQL